MLLEQKFSIASVNALHNNIQQKCIVTMYGEQVIVFVRDRCDLTDG